ncbi:MAG: peptidoglycan-binding protein [Oscillospiraceae bacterium]|nr:peptidoglycan-binding protein [Oscillospiraceae bacterium]
MYSPEQEKAHIYELQQMLYGISLRNPAIPGVIPDGIYGEETAAAVRAFQQIYGLRVTGEANVTTWEKIAEVYRETNDMPPEPLAAFPEKPGTVLHEGAHCFTVMIAQAILLALSEEFENIPACAVTGVLDPETVRALQLFQKLCSLPVTGCVDCTTWNMLSQAGGSLAVQKPSSLSN